MPRRSMFLPFAVLGILMLALSGPIDLVAAEPPLSSAAEVIDQYVDALLASEGIQPAPAASEEVLIRRLTLDLAGRPATSKEIREFVESAEVDKRERLVSRLLASPDFREQQTAELGTILMGPGSTALKAYLEQAVAENRSWDRIFRELILSETKETAPFLRTRVNDLDQLTNDTSIVFFGINISCAQCHTHPLVDEWTQDRFFGMKSFFARTFEHGDWVGERDYGQVDFKTPAGESKQAEPLFFTGIRIDEPEQAEPDDAAKKAAKEQLDELKKKKEPAPAPSFSRRAALVEIALAPENQTYLARAIVNRMWKRFYGTGLVDPADQMHPQNTASHPQLLDWLAADFIQHSFDLRRLTESLVSTNAYARSSRWSNGAERPLPQQFAVAEVRALTPSQYAAALRFAAASSEFFEVDDQEHQRRVERLRRESNGMARNFEPVVDNFQVSVIEALAMSNDQQLLNQLLRDGGETLLGQLKTIDNPQEQAELALRQVFGRPADSALASELASYLEQRSDRPDDARRQLLWALLCSGDCRFNY